MVTNVVECCSVRVRESLGEVEDVINNQFNDIVLTDIW